MEFRNENTFLSLGEKIHSKFENAIKRVRKKYFNKKYPLIINGKKIYKEETIETFSPIDENIKIAKFSIAKLEDCRNAINAAYQSFTKWKEVDWRKRIKIFSRAEKVARKYKFEIAAIISYENGKNRFESIGEVDEGIDFIKYYSYLIKENNGLIIERKVRKEKVSGKFGFQGAISKGERVRIVAEPYGVWSVISPFNFPFSISIGMVSAALITGNTVVFKPSFGDNPTPLSGYFVYKIFEEAGLIKGALNYITGFSSEIGDELITNEKVSGIAFTGSREVGKSIIRKVASLEIPKQIVMEMGSKNPVIVSKYANLEKAVKGVISAAFGFCGQKCSAASRLIIHESIYKKFIEMLIERIKEIKIGNPLEKDVYMGPLISKKAVERFEETVKKGKVIYGGKKLFGNYVEPTIIEVDIESEIFKKELFLPILAVTKYKDFEEAVKIANNTEYGLTAGLYSENEKEIEYFKNNIEFGTIYINRDVSATTGAIVGWQSFVGWKGSSFSCKGTSSLSYLYQFVRERSETVVL